MKGEWMKLKDEFRATGCSDELMHALDHILDMEYAHDKELYDKSIMCLYKARHGEHFNEHLAIEAVKHMCNADGSTGAKWSLAQTKNCMMSVRADSALYNEYDFYYVMNMLWSDHYEVLGSDANIYSKLAVSWLEDKDVAEGKAFRYYFNVAKGE